MFEKDYIDDKNVYERLCPWKIVCVTKLCVKDCLWQIICDRLCACKIVWVTKLCAKDCL